VSPPDDPSSRPHRPADLGSAWRGARDSVGGALRPTDPRRFLLEVVIGAMNADGRVDQREQAVLERYVSSHELFANVLPHAARTLVELAGDAIRFAGSPTARIPAIARGLPARIHRLTAYAIACEVVTADAELTPDETTFVESLRQALRVAPHEATDLYHALTAGQLQPHLRDRELRLRSLVPTAVELFTLRARALGRLTDDHRFALRDLFLGLPDLALSSDELDGLFFRAFRAPRPPAVELPAELAALAAALPDPADRWWMAAYVLAAEPPGQAASWRVIPFVAQLQRAFGLADGELDAAAADAAALPATLPRPT
jgi:uncharacterized tellurite resistance protein B-like protein